MFMESWSEGALDHHRAFDLAPIPMVLSRQRTIVDCNQRVAVLFACTRDELIGASLAVLYPSATDFERIGQRIAAGVDASGRYADERIMKREPGRPTGELFWCHVVGQALNVDSPHEAGIWAFDDLSSARPVLSGAVGLTERERDVATLLIGGRTSRQIADALGISRRTVEVHRASLKRKYGAESVEQLIEQIVERGH